MISSWPGLARNKDVDARIKSAQDDLMALLMSPEPDSRFRGNECVREGALSARCKSVPEPVAGSEIEGNCVAARRGGEQPEVNRQSVG